MATVRPRGPPTDQDGPHSFAACSRLWQQMQCDQGPITRPGQELHVRLAAGVLEPAGSAGDRELERAGPLDPGRIDFALRQHQDRMILFAVVPDEAAILS
jgi:hypothetical protein